MLRKSNLDQNHHGESGETKDPQSGIIHPKRGKGSDHIVGKKVDLALTLIYLAPFFAPSD